MQGVPIKHHSDGKSIGLKRTYFCFLNPTWLFGHRLNNGELSDTLLRKKGHLVVARPMEKKKMKVKQWKKL